MYSIQLIMINPGNPVVNCKMFKRWPALIILSVQISINRCWISTGCFLYPTHHNHWPFLPELTSKRRQSHTPFQTTTHYRRHLSGVPVVFLKRLWNMLFLLLHIDNDGFVILRKMTNLNIFKQVVWHGFSMHFFATSLLYVLSVDRTQWFWCHLCEQSLCASGSQRPAAVETPFFVPSTCLRWDKKRGSLKVSTVWLRLRQARDVMDRFCLESRCYVHSWKNGWNPYYMRPLKVLMHHCKWLRIEDA